MTNHNIVLLKNSYSEDVIRKSLYWLSAKTSWELEQDLDNWIISLEINSTHNIREFNRLLNDQVLREMIDKETGMIRRSIIRKVLNSLDSSL